METDVSSLGSLTLTPPSPPLSSQPRSSLSCTHCGKQLPCEAKKIEHERIHTGDKPFRCKYAAFCTASFARKDNLNRHYVRVHPGEEPVPKRERSSSGVENLERVRPSQKKPRRGVIAEKIVDATPVSSSAGNEEARTETSGQVEDLSRHTSEITSSYESSWIDPHQKDSSLPRHKSVSKSSPSKLDLSCSQCGHTFTKRQHLNSHEKTHEALVQDRAIFHCNHTGCQKSFTAKSNLSAHIRAVHGHVRFECAGCGETFAHKQTLVRHRHRQPNESVCREKM